MWITDGSWFLTAQIHRLISAEGTHQKTVKQITNPLREYETEAQEQQTPVQARLGLAKDFAHKHLPRCF